MGRQIASRVFGRLRLHPRQRASRLGLHCADRLTIQIQQIVRKTISRLHLEFADGDATAGGQVEFIAALNHPSGSRQFGVDFAPRFLFECFRHRPAPNGCD